VAQPGAVESTRFPYLQARWVTQSQSGQAWALADTGFDGYLALPASELERLGEPDTLEPWRLANGDTVYVPEYRGTIQVAGLPNVIPAIILVLGDEFIVGRAVLDRFWVTFDHGRRLVVEP